MEDKLKSQEKMQELANTLKNTLETIIADLEQNGGKDYTIFNLDEVELTLLANNQIATSSLIRDGVITVGNQVLKIYDKNSMLFITSALKVINSYAEYLKGLEYLEEFNIEKQFVENAS